MARHSQELPQNLVNDIWVDHPVFINEQNIGTVMSRVIVSRNGLYLRSVDERDVTIGQVVDDLPLLDLRAQIRRSRKEQELNLIQDFSTLLTCF